MDKNMRTIVAGLRVTAAELEPGEERDLLVRLAKRLSTAQGFGDPFQAVPYGGPGGEAGGEPGVDPAAAAGPGADEEEAVPGYSGAKGGITDPLRAPRQYWTMSFKNFPAMTYEECLQVGKEIEAAIQSKGDAYQSVMFDPEPRAQKTDRPNMAQ